MPNTANVLVPVIEAKKKLRICCPMHNDNKYHVEVLDKCICIEMPSKPFNMLDADSQNSR